MCRAMAQTVLPEPAVPVVVPVAVAAMPLTCLAENGLLPVAQAVVAAAAALTAVPAAVGTAQPLQSIYGTMALTVTLMYVSSIRATLLPAPMAAQAVPVVVVAMGGLPEATTANPPHTITVAMAAQAGADRMAAMVVQVALAAMAYAGLWLSRAAAQHLFSQAVQLIAPQPAAQLPMAHSQQWFRVKGVQILSLPLPNLPIHGPRMALL